MMTSLSFRTILSITFSVFMLTASTLKVLAAVPQNGEETTPSTTPIVDATKTAALTPPVPGVGVGVPSDTKSDGLAKAGSETEIEHGTETETEHGTETETEHGTETGTEHGTETGTEHGSSHDSGNDSGHDGGHGGGEQGGGDS
ncbi:MAG: hypothetical protein OHK0012_06330 [Synechococcales cyanobacterium]